MKTTKHTCNEGHGPVFGKRTVGCPRCEELSAGAAPVRWSTAKRDRDAAFRREFAAHDCKARGCGPVCTFGDW